MNRADRARLEKLDGAADILARLLGGVERGEIEATPAERVRLAALVTSLQEFQPPNP